MPGEEPIRIVIAEDDYLVSEEIARVVKSVGYELVGEAADGAEAVALTEELRPDVVLMDVRMPDMDGLEATRRIQEQCPTPVVILTAHESQDLVELATEAGVSAYITKPPRPGEIERAVTVALARHGDLMELRRLNGELQERNAALQQALDEIKTLRGILPICSYCKRVRNDEGFWQQVESYIRSHSEAEFSHGICPECLEERFPEG